jgi:hypothetical protein
MGYRAWLLSLISRIVGGLFSKDQRFDRNEAKRSQKERTARLHRFKMQDVDRARAAAALAVAASTRAEARALAIRLEQENEEEPSAPEIKSSKLNAASST